MKNPVVQWQIVAPQPAALAEFYTKLFGWTVDANNALGYRAIDTGSHGTPGGIWPSPPGAPPMVQLFVQVDDIDACIAQALALGARVLMPKQVLPDGDSMALLLDPAGLSMGLMTPRASTATP